MSGPPIPAIPKSAPALPSESALAEAFATSDAPASLLTAFWLDQFVRRLPRSRPAEVRRRAAALAREARRFVASPAMQPEARTALSHLARVGAAAFNLCAAALEHDGRGLGDDRAVNAAFQSLSALVFADGAVDGAEQGVLHSAVRVVSFEPPPAGVTSLLWMLAAGRRAPALDAESISLTEDILGPVHLTLWRNRGVLRVKTPGYPPDGYRWISPSDPLVRGRNASKECFSFAFSNDPKWEMPGDLSADQLLRDQYRPIELATEKAQPGDIVAYYPLIWSLDRTKRDVISGGTEHVAVVTVVNGSGRPVRVASKVGWRLGVFEHPIAEAPLSVGVLWGVFRRRDPSRQPLHDHTKRGL